MARIIKMSSRRLNTLQNHLLSQSALVFNSQPLMEAYKTKGKELNRAELRNFYFYPHTEEIEAQLQAVNESPLFDQIDEITMTRDEKRKRTVEQLIYLYQRFPITFEESQRKATEKFKLAKVYGYMKGDLLARYGVQMFLYLDSIETLGTEKHIPLMRRAYTYEDFGCFGMTELGHGSDLNQSEIHATYDHSTREFVLHSPIPTAAKWWIGGAGKISNTAVVYCRTFVDGVHRGTNGFVIPIRDRITLEALPGVILGDCGSKTSLDGVDNGFIRFDNYRVPYDCLLDKLIQIDENGKFQSLIESNSKRYVIILTSMIRGRLACGVLASTAMHTALTIALRFAASRQQYSLSGTQNDLILDLPLHRYRLIPQLAKMFAVNTSLQKIFDFYDSINDVVHTNPASNEGSLMYNYLSVFKPLWGWYSNECLHECREACGSYGTLATSMLAKIKENSDPIVTWEGDNNIFIRAASRYIMKQIQLKAKGKPVELPEFEFLEENFDRLMQTRANFDSIDTLTNQKLIEALEYKVSFLAHRSNAIFDMNMERYKNSVLADNSSMVYGMKDLNIAYGELFMARELLLRISGIQDPNNREIMNYIFRLFCAHTIERSTGYLMESYMNADHIRTIRVEVLRLCKHVGDNSIRIIEALELPDKLVGSSLGQSDGQLYANVMAGTEESLPNEAWVQRFVEKRNRGFNRQKLISQFGQ